jgi:hypothetical protein
LISGPKNWLNFYFQKNHLWNIAFRLERNATESDIGCACEHFISLNHSLFSVEILRILLTDDRLLIKSEDWLFEVLKTLIAKDSSYEPLIDTIESQYLSESLMGDFCEMLNPTSLTGILSLISQRTLKSLAYFRQLIIRMCAPLIFFNDLTILLFVMQSLSSSDWLKFGRISRG